MKFRSRFFSVTLLLLVSAICLHSTAQDWVRTGSNLGNARIRIAAADFKPLGTDPQTPALKATFDSTLYNDLSSAGIFDVASKSFAPQVTPGTPQEINLAQWSAAPANAANATKAAGASSSDQSFGQVLAQQVNAPSSSTPSSKPARGIFCRRKSARKSWTRTRRYLRPPQTRRHSEQPSVRR